MNFSDLKLPIPDNIYKKNTEVQKNIYDYLLAMNDIQKEAYIVAYEHLGSSFNIIKSNGYNEWLQSRNKPHS